MSPENTDATDTASGTAATPPAGNLLRNGNRGGDPRVAARCGAKNRAGTPCRGAALKGRKRCRHHGGASTGPKSAAGKKRASREIHGGFSAETLALLEEMRRLRAQAEAYIADVERQWARKRAATATPNTDGEPNE